MLLLHMKVKATRVCEAVKYFLKEYWNKKINDKHNNDVIRVEVYEV